MLPSPPMVREWRPRPPWRLLTAFLGMLALWAACMLTAQTPPTQENPSKTTANQQEISSRDVVPTFKLQAERNLVMVRVVVRNNQGATVDNLRKEDFQLFDRGKLQTILHFSLEKPAQKAAATAPQAAPKPTEPEVEEETARPASAAQRFVALYFDDVSTTFEGIVRAREAADHFITTSLQPGDRVALFTASGQKQVDFTSDVAQIRQALSELHQRPIAGQDTSSCVDIPPYEAFLIVVHNDPTALAVATLKVGSCEAGIMDGPQSAQAHAPANEDVTRFEANRLFTLAETEAKTALQGIESVVRRMTAVPGQRSIIIVSEGFLTETLHYELSQIADRALRANVILNALDARGLYTDPHVADVTPLQMAAWFRQHPGLLLSVPLQTAPHAMAVQSARRQTDGMQSLALDTGGLFFHNSNDLGEGLRELAAPPEAFYVLAFSPQNLKTDGSFHPLQVKLVEGKGLMVQARKGYYAPSKPNDPAVQEKEEIREAVFSQDETHELPIDVRTQFFMKDESNARITVLTHIDLRLLHFRKDADRNLDDLTFVTVLFDHDGHVVNAEQKAVKLLLRDHSLEKYLQTGITMRNLFDVKPGTYLVRSIVRDAESGQISGLNRTVEIPF